MPRSTVLQQDLAHVAVVARQPQRGMPGRCENDTEKTWMNRRTLHIQFCLILSTEKSIQFFAKRMAHGTSYIIGYLDYMHWPTVACISSGTPAGFTSNKRPKAQQAAEASTTGPFRAAWQFWGSTCTCNNWIQLAILASSNRGRAKWIRGCRVCAAGPSCRIHCPGDC